MGKRMPSIFKKPQVNDEARLIDKLNIPLNQPADLAVWAVKRTGIRCRLIPSQEPITFRMIRDEVEGEIITVQPAKIWQFKKTVYMSGETIGSRLDAKALGLKPLELKDEGIWEPVKEDELFDPGDPFEKYYLPIMAYGPRREFIMEQVIPFQDPDDWDSDPILQAADAHEAGDSLTARKIIAELLSADLRCLDAHAHLGSWMFNLCDKPDKHSEDKAKRHFEVGLRIAELSLGVNFHDLLPWGYIDNRPLMRCLHGYGLCLWRSGDKEAARQVFERMLWLNPRDNQGARFLLVDIDAGRTWYEISTEEENERMK
jgi:hypothetical protein